MKIDLDKDEHRLWTQYVIYTEILGLTEPKDPGEYIHHPALQVKALHLAKKSVSFFNENKDKEFN
jgi:hypothetical protein